MSKVSNLVTAGIFIAFLAILFHYFCRVRKKPALIVQQQVQVPEGYVYPISSNLSPSQQMMGQSNFTPMQPPFIMPQNVPYPFPYPNNIVIGAGGVSSSHPHQPAYPPANFSQAMHPSHAVPSEDMPPPYHVAVASSPYPPK